MEKLILIALLILYICLENIAKAKINTKVNLDYQGKISIWLAENNVPTVGIGLIENGEIRHAKVFEELKKGAPMSDNAIVNVASMTKPVVAMLTLKLIEAGQWYLDAPKFHYWINSDAANVPEHKKLTTRHMLSHQTGFPNCLDKIRIRSTGYMKNNNSVQAQDYFQFLILCASLSAILLGGRRTSPPSDLAGNLRHIVRKHIRFNFNLPGTIKNENARISPPSLALQWVNRAFYLILPPASSFPPSFKKGTPADRSADKSLLNLQSLVMKIKKDWFLHQPSNSSISNLKSSILNPL